MEDFENNQENPCSDTYPGQRPITERETEYHFFKLVEFQQLYAKRASLTVQGWGGSIKVPYTSPELLVTAQKLATMVDYTAEVREMSSGSGSATINTKIDLTFEFYPSGNAIAPGSRIEVVGEELVQVVQALQAELVGCQEGDLLVGNGRGDITGTVTMANMMGFAAPGQDATGLHGRLYSR